LPENLALGDLQDRSESSVISAKIVREISSFARNKSIFGGLISNDSYLLFSIWYFSFLHA